MTIDVLEIATPQNFDGRRYLLANHDVKAAGMDPRIHFDHHGRAEGRKQIVAAFDRGSDYLRQKFERFRDVLSLQTPASTFPIFTSSQHFDLSEYLFESANASFTPFVEEMERNPGKRYLDLGCGLRDKVLDNCLYLEVYPSMTADLIVEANKPYPIKTGTLDGIGCFAVLEHARRPWEVVEEIDRMLKPGGVVFIDWPFLQPVHGFPSHYFNATREGLHTIFADRGFKTSQIGTLSYQGPSATLYWILSKLLHDLPPKQRDLLGGMTVRDLAAAPAEGDLWSRILQGVADTTISEFACGNTLIATKPR